VQQNIAQNWSRSSLGQSCKVCVLVEDNILNAYRKYSYCTVYHINWNYFLHFYVAINNNNIVNRSQRAAPILLMWKQAAVKGVIVINQLRDHLKIRQKKSPKNRLNWLSNCL